MSEETKRKPLQRSLTIDLSHKANDAYLIQPSEQFFRFEEPTESIEDELFSVVESRRFKIGANVYDDTMRKALVKEISNVQGDPQHPSPALVEFGEKIVEIYSACNGWEGLAMYPPRLLDPSQEAKDLTFVLVDLLKTRKNSYALSYLKWVFNNIAPKQSLTNKEFKSSILKACCICHRKRKLFPESRNFWAVLDIRNHFCLYLIENGVLSLHMEGDVASIKLSRSGKTVKIFDKQGLLMKRFIPVDQTQNELWANAMKKPDLLPKLPLFFTTTDEPIPEIMLFALNEALLSDDLNVVRALVHFSVTKVSPGEQIAEALFDIFSYAGKVNALLELLAAMEFTNSELKFDTVLRGNSHLSNLLKVYVKRFGRKYYDEFLKRIILYIDSKGDLKLKKPVEADSQKAKTMVFTVLRRIAGSLSHVPPEIRHISSVLKNAASIRFNSKQATYNTLSGFFNLRFISKIISNPLDTDPDLHLQNSWEQVLLPAAQLLMTPFNLIEMTGKYEIFNSWNAELRKKVFPEFINFVFSIGIIDEAPDYQPPTKERLRESLRIIWNEIGKSGTRFQEKYQELSQEQSPCSPQAWSFAIFIASYFEQNNS